MELLEDKILTARNKHTCRLCGKEINKGTSYHDYYIQDGGELVHFRVHTECESEDFNVLGFIREQRR